MKWGNVFTGQGTVSGNTISGSYSGTNSDCSDSGTFTGTQVPNLGGTFSGTLGFPSGSDQTTATLTEGTNYSFVSANDVELWSRQRQLRVLRVGSGECNVCFRYGERKGLFLIDSSEEFMG